MTNPLGTRERPREIAVIVILFFSLLCSLLLWIWLIVKFYGGG